jgi:hypothetical protein
MPGYRTRAQIQWDRERSEIERYFARRAPVVPGAREPEIDRLRAMLAQLADFHVRNVALAAEHLAQLGDRDRERLRPQYEERAAARAAEIADVERRIAAIGEASNVPS